MRIPDNKPLRGSATPSAKRKCREHGGPAWMLALLLVLFAGSLGAAQGDAKRGAIAYRACIACHSLEPSRHLTGPSLAGLIGRKAGTADRFLRYSEAMKKSGVVWSEQTLDAWLANPARFIPNNDMVFPGMPDSQARQDLVAYLKAAEEGKVPRAGQRLPRLKAAQAQDIISSMRHCGDTYFLATETGQNLKIWEFNLRLKVDSSEFGPHPGRPVVVGMGMQGDRAAVVFAQPSEISAFIKQKCE